MAIGIAPTKLGNGGTFALTVPAKVHNLLDSRDNDIAYYYESYIPGSDVAPVEGRLSRVVEPRTLRVGAKIRF